MSDNARPARSTGRAAVLTLLVGVCAGCGPSERPADACAGVGHDGVVQVEQGALRGHGSGATCAFTGIPYAAPPVAKLRFFEAMPAVHWTGVRDADTRSPWCPQLASDGTPIGDEDCLYLNVWTTRTTAAASPVLVFVHGGGNVTGSSSEAVYDGAQLAARSGAVVVTFDYRLGPLGYLAHPALGARSGNYGLSDLTFALSWVRDNVARFGGDPGRVLAFGQSAGSRNLCTLLSSVPAPPLFRAAALESGACEIQSESDALAFGARFVQNTACDGAADVVSCLRSLTTDEILTALPDEPDPLTTSHYNPNDSVTAGETPLQRLHEDTEAEPVPVIVGANADETGYIEQPLFSVSDYDALLRITFGSELGGRVLSLYPPDDFESVRDAWNAVLTDYRYVCPSGLTADALQSNPRRKAYRYLFSHGLDRGPRRGWGAFHGLELLFLFGNFDAIGYDPTPDEESLSDRMIDYWTRFADTGDPNEARATPWPAYDSQGRAYLDVDTTIRSDAALHRAQCDFWNSLGGN